MDLAAYTGPAAFPRPYRIMLERDAHAPGSVDCVLSDRMVRLVPVTVEHIYSDFTPLEVRYTMGSRPRPEEILRTAAPVGASAEERLAGIAAFTRDLGERAPEDIEELRLGGTEEEIVERGSDWCTDVARVACILAQVAGFLCRLVNLFDLDHAYSGHVIVEAYRDGWWGAIDPITGVVYRHAGGRPASVRELMGDDALVGKHGEDGEEE